MKSLSVLEIWDLPGQNIHATAVYILSYSSFISFILTTLTEKMCLILTAVIISVEKFETLYILLTNQL